MNKNFDLVCTGFSRFIEREKFFDDEINYGKHYIFRFNNNYGASVIKNKHSYGFKNDLWDVAVITFPYLPLTKHFEIVYDTPITDNVVVNLSDEEVCEILEKISKL